VLGVRFDIIEHTLDSGILMPDPTNRGCNDCHKHNDIRLCIPMTHTQNSRSSPDVLINNNVYSV